MSRVGNSASAMVEAGAIFAGSTFIGADQTADVLKFVYHREIRIVVHGFIQDFVLVNVEPRIKIGPTQTLNRYKENQSFEASHGGDLDRLRGLI